MNPITRLSDGFRLQLYVQPKASRDKIVGLHDNELKIAITSPPIDGKANAHLVKYLAKLFKTTKQNIIIEKGETGRHKQVRVLHPQHEPDDFIHFI